MESLVEYLTGNIERGDDLANQVVENFQEGSTERSGGRTLFGSVLGYAPWLIAMHENGGGEGVRVPRGWIDRNASSSDLEQTASRPWGFFAHKALVAGDIESLRICEAGLAQ